MFHRRALHKLFHSRLGGFSAMCRRREFRFEACSRFLRSALRLREPRYLVIFAGDIDTQRSTRRAFLIERRLG
ncbi:hypothetical protein P0D88_13030 [Paraburkholderia sp. RL18-103-BIB-C]|uniref:hypothetical protein n=1 Tax=unclassified Paraburkholderia TaxID=2615204 RepID=UPI0038BAAB83